ncbi:hemolysin family protein [Perlucidibaca piscinae]|uniref:hemolysin family protein n=1 Tax=Perlucidibaca piscinae TaxID=392589 RepID=UPI0003B4DF00|nr:hemolysin family protein [Perlucidibaca piscinae]
MNASQPWLIVLVLVAISAFFSLSEISLAAARRIKLTVLADAGDARAAAVLALQANPGYFFTGIQVGVNAVAILAGLFGESLLTPTFTLLLGLLYQGPWLDSISLALSFVVLTSLFILFADLLPKRLAMRAPEQVAMRIIAPMQAFITLCHPLVWCFDSLTRRLLRLAGINERTGDDITTDDIQAMVDAGTQAGLLLRNEQQAIDNIFELESRLVTSAMTTRESVSYLTLQDSEDELRAQIMRHVHSKFLVCDDVIDRVVGYVESKDLLNTLLSQQPLALPQSSAVKPVLSVPDSLSLSELLAQFRASREDFAVVLNEYALVVGVVTLNDVMNTVMGDLVTLNQQQIVRRDDGSWLVDGFTPVEDVMRTLEITHFPDDEHYETIAGFMMYQLRKVPRLTDHVDHAGYRFEVIDVDNHRIDQLLVTRNAP